MNPLFALDNAIQSALDVNRNPFLVEWYRLLTHLGDARAITVVALALAVILWRHKRYAYKVGLAISILGSLSASYGIKLLIHRPRPLAPFALFDESGYSFPSMHAAVSMATYGFLIYMVWRLMRPPHHKLPFMVLLGFLIFLIGFSRVYLGVHYASDVFVGYVVGLIFLCLGMLATQRLTSANASDREA